MRASSGDAAASSPDAARSMTPDDARRRAADGVRACLPRRRIPLMACELTADEIRVLKAIAAGVLALEKKGGAASARSSSSSSASARSSGGGAPSSEKVPSGEVAPDADLDSQYGDPTIKFDPKRWS